MDNARLLTRLVLASSMVLIAALGAAPSGQELPVQVVIQRDGREAESGPTGTAMLSGTVTVTNSGQPARKTRVRLSGGGIRGGRTVFTDAFGRFAFVSLAAGRYSLSASKPGHVTVQYGQQRPGPGRSGTPIQLAEGQQLEVQLQMPRGGVITGTVLDEHGEAVPGTPVRALRYAVQNGERRLVQAGTNSTDDRGIYRIYGLQPADYVVAATPRNTAGAARIEIVREQVAALRERAEAPTAGDAAEARVLAERISAGMGTMPGADEAVAGYAPVYYPGVTSVASAATIAVGVGEEKMGIDFGLQLVTLARIEGVVVTSSGEAAQNIRVSLVNADQTVPGVRNGSARPDRDGRFRLTNVAPGHYLLLARGTIGGGRGGRGAALSELALAVQGRRGGEPRPEPVRLWAMSEVVVDGRNISNIVLNLQPGMTVSGRLVFQGTATLPTDLTRLRVRVSPAEPAGADRETARAATARADASGRFTITGVTPGRYRITASGATQGWRLASSEVSGEDSLDFPIEVKPNEPVSGAVLTFTDRTTEITGTIVNERGEPASDYTIIVFPADRQFWTPGSRRIASQRPGTDGRFAFRNLPAGDYRIAPIFAPEPGSWYDPALLQQLETTALRVPLADGESKVQNLRIGGM